VDRSPLAPSRLWLAGAAAEILSYWLYIPGYSAIASLNIPLLTQVSGLPSSLTFSPSMFDPNSPYNSSLSITGSSYSQLLYL